MRIQLLVVSGFILISPLYMALADSISSINQLVVFGDSLSDNGNAYIGSGGVFPGPNYATGEYTDGPSTTPATTGPFGLWDQQFAAKAGLPSPQPFAAGTGGTDYAVASATTGSNGLYDVTDQLNIFGAAHPTGAPSNALYTFWAGANDIDGAQNPITAADNIYKNILALSAAGGKDFLWLNLPALGNTPEGVASGQSALLNAASNAFNAEWAIDIAKLQSLGINVIGVNIGVLFDQIEADPSAYGFTNVTAPAQGLSGVNPNDYLFWDDVHPTTAGDALIANLAYNDFVAAPEPRTFGLLALCGILFAGFGIGRKLKPENCR